MPRPKRTARTVRLNLEMHEAVRARIENLKESTQADSMAEVIRRALAVYSSLYDATQEGGKIIIKNGAREIEVLIPEYED